MLSILGIALALGVLIVLAYRGVSVLLLAPLAASLAVVLTPDTPLLASYTQVFMVALGGFVVLYFPLFLLGALFGKLMEASGAAMGLAQAIVRALGPGQAILAVASACALLTYGGVSLFVVAFAVYPIAAELFRQAQVPKRLVPATIALGAFTFTMTALPGTPAIQNAIPMPYFGTTPFAAPGLGVLAALVMAAGGLAWLSWRLARARQHGEGYGVHDDTTRGGPPAPDLAAVEPLPWWMALLPIVAVLLINLLVGEWWLPRLDTDYLAQTLYGQTRLDAVRGVWSIIVALCAAIVLLGCLAWHRLPKGMQVFNEGVSASVMPMFNTASLVGFGAVIASLSGFGLIRDAVMGVGSEHVLVSLAIVVNVLAGITGSASGGMSIALQALGDDYLALGQSQGVSPELMHRVTSIATGGLDALPHNGAVITLLEICRLTHRQSYLDIAVVAVFIPLLALGLVIALGTTLGSF